MPRKTDLCMALWLVIIDKVRVWIQTKILANTLLTGVYVTTFHPWHSCSHRCLALPRNLVTKL